MGFRDYMKNLMDKLAFLEKMDDYLEFMLSESAFIQD